jgi:hypothetical protein
VGSKNQLGRLLNRQFVGGDSDALKLLLARAKIPNQAARDRYFLTLLSRAKVDLIQRLRAGAAEKKHLAEAVRERQARLADRAPAAGKPRPVAGTQEAAADAGRHRRPPEAQRREIDTLRRDEQRLTRLIDGLIRIADGKKSRRRRHVRVRGSDAAVGRSR